MSKPALGFIGLGNMGGPMSTRLVKAGHEVFVYDRDEAALSRAVAAGCKRLESIQAVADQVETVILSLPTPDIVKAVALQDGGLKDGHKVKQVVDLSTIGPRAVAEICQGLAAHGKVYIDSPVSGGVQGAIKGTLAVMVACPRVHFEALESILANFGPVFFLGEQAGQGQTVKVANNIMSATAVAITSEAVVMGVKAGIDPKVMLDVINVSSGRNTASMDKFPRCVLPRTFDVGFAAALAYKDVRLCVEEAEQMGVPMVVGSAVREMLTITLAACGPDADFCDVVKVVESWAGVEVKG